MIDKTTTLLLQIISTSGNINKLRHQDISFRKIAELIDENIKKGNLISENGKISLTDEGKAYLKENEHSLKNNDKSKWIDLDYKNKIQQIDKDDVFLPAQNALSFLK